MKHLFAYLILSFTILEVNAATVDTLLAKDYKRGYEVVHELIESKSLKDSLINRSFCSLFFNNLWTITVEKEESYVLYYGYRVGRKEVVRKEISNTDTVLNRLFSLEQDKIEHSIYKPSCYYTPIYWYFVLSDALHNKKFEWNAYSQSDDKYTKVWLDAFTDFYAYLMNITQDDIKTE